MSASGNGASASGNPLLERLDPLLRAPVAHVSERWLTIPVGSPVRVRFDRSVSAVADVVLRTKSNYSAPADAHIVAEIRNWDAVISGIGD